MIRRSGRPSSSSPEVGPRRPPRWRPTGSPRSCTCRPGLLLRQYLDAGARRFVFEGIECGGHVGPWSSCPCGSRSSPCSTRSSTSVGGPGRRCRRAVGPLAGGIHDARSAAMVAVVAAPLAARGVAVGLLMGTAYLLTDEAVRTGAILPGFRRHVLDASSTALLRTAPGHLTRCVPSPFVDALRAVPQTLHDERDDRTGGLDRAGDVQRRPIAPGEQGRGAPGRRADHGRRRPAGRRGALHGRAGGDPARHRNDVPPCTTT